MGLWNDQNEVLMEEGAGFEFEICEGKRDDAEVEIALNDFFRYFVCRATVDFEFDVRPFFGEGADVGRQEIEGVGIAGADAQLPRRRVVLIGDFLRNVAGMQEEFLSFFVEDFSLRGGGAPRPVEQGMSEFFFESFDLLGDGGLGAVELVGGFSEVSQLYDRAEGVYGIEIQHSDKYILSKP